MPIASWLKPGDCTLGDDCHIGPPTPAASCHANNHWGPSACTTASMAAAKRFWSHGNGAPHETPVRMHAAGAGVRWMEGDAGPLAHFQTRPAQPGADARGTRRTSDTSGDGASPAPLPSRAPPGSPFAAAQGPSWDSPDILVAWRSQAQPQRPSGEALGLDAAQPAVGAVHLTACKLQVGVPTLTPPSASMPMSWRSLAPVRMRGHKGQG